MLKNRLLLVILHLLSGFLMTISIVPKLVTVLVILYAIIDIVASKNNNNQAFLWTSYFISAEVLLRMTGGAISWEMVKYITIIFLFIGIFVENTTRGIPVVFCLYILLLFVGVAFSEIPAEESIRKALVFNLSGPITLGISAIYFYNRSIEYKRFKEVLFFSLLPILSMLTLLYFKTPSLKEITFGSTASHVASGGFGPNQVATVLGFGIFLFATLLMLKEKISGYLIIDVLLLFYLIYRGLITFSRGGILTGFIAFLLFSFFHLLAKGKPYHFFKYIGIMLLMITTVWIYSTNITGGMLENRYLGKNSKGEQKEDISSGRLDIFEKEMKVFMENPLFGIGVGSGKYYRREVLNEENALASHNEMSRLLEEHGLIGLFSLLMLFYAIIINFLKQNFYYKGFIIAFASLWFLTINHSAMRIGFPAFVYGLSLINFYEGENYKEKLDTLGI